MRRPTLAFVAALALAVVILPLGCGEEPTLPGMSPIILAGNGQQGTVGQQLPGALIVQALDSRGRPARRVDVRWTVTSGGGHPAIDVNRTDNNGTTFNHWTLGTTLAQPQRLEARVVGTNELLGAFSATAVAGPAAQIAAAAGDGQTAAHGTQVSVPPAVRVTDQYGNPASGITVTFSVASGGGSITGTTASPDGNGIATVGSWTLGPTPGPNTLTATAQGLSGSPVTFTATATVGAAAHLTLHAGDGQTAAVGTTVPIAPAMRVTDAAGFPVAGVRPTITMVQGTSAVATGPALISNAEGISAVAFWTMGSAPGTYIIRAVVAGVPDTVFFTATAVAGPAGTVTIHAGNNQTRSANTAVPILPAVAVRDAFNNPVPGVTVDFAVTAGGGTISGTPATTDAQGVATLGSWVLGPTAGQNALSATVSGAGSVTFTATALAQRAAVTTTRITFSPHEIVASTGEQTAIVTITARDSFNVPVPGATVILEATGSGNALTQPATVTDANGVTTATFSSTVAEYKNVRANIDGVITWYGTLRVIGGPPATIAVYAGNNQLASVGTAVSESLQVLVRDQFGNGSWGTLVNWEVTSGGGTIAANSSPGVFPNGVATSGAWTLGPTAGPNTVRAWIDATALEATFTATGDPAFWTTLAPMPTGRMVLASAALNGHVYAVGGMDLTDMPTVEAYDPATNTWSARTPMPGPRSELGAAVVNGVLYAMGGIVDRALVATVEAYDPATDTWTARAPMPSPRSDFGVAVVNGLIYTIGGSCSSGPCGLVEVYDPGTDTWTTRTPMPTPRLAVGTAEVGGIIYVMGGFNNAVFQLATVEAYDPATDSWTTRSSMPVARHGPGAGALGGTIYVMGGYVLNPESGFADIVRTVNAYDPVTDVWSAKPPMAVGRTYFGTAVLGGLLYVMGGNGSFTDLEALHPF